jgi:plasmid stability protein
MAELKLTVPDDLKSRLNARAMESGFDSVEAYARAVLAASAEPQVVEEDLEEMLLARLDDSEPGIEVTPQFKQGFLDEIRARRQSDGK